MKHDNLSDLSKMTKAVSSLYNLPHMSINYNKKMRGLGELIVSSLCLAAVTGVTVNTKYGDVIGQTHQLNTGQSVNSFLAIPFAKPPVGNLRFAKSEEPDAWTEPHVGNTLGPACPQDGGILLLTHILWDRFDEDCLHMNIYTPEDASGGPYPVMVWFHGGGYSGSANIQYPGYFLAAKDVVVVVPNYRLGALGFVSTDDEIAPGNWGLWDQNLALKFVQENIEDFGGDPTRVTLFGQSAGASSAGMHVVSPQSTGLFHQVIYESGSDHTLWALNYPESNPTNYTRQLAVRVNCSIDEGSAVMIACLREKDTWTIQENQGVTCTPGWFCQGFGPVVDGQGGFLPLTPQEIRQKGDHNKADVMAGQCNKDGSPYTASFVPEAIDGGFNRSVFLDLIKNRAVAYFADRSDNNKTLEDMFQALTFQYTPWPYMDDTDEDDRNRQAVNDMVTDVGFGYAQDSVNKIHMEDGNDVYYYILSYRSLNASDLIPEWIGVPHNGELPYIWGFVLMRLNEDLREETEMWVDIIDWNDRDVVYAYYMLDLWTNFAKFGNPTPQPVTAPDGGETTWKKYEQDSLDYLDIGPTIEIKLDYRQKYFAFWQQYVPYITNSDTFSAMRKIVGGLQNGESKVFDRMLEEEIERIVRQKQNNLL